MKKILSLLTITALLGSSVALHARKPAPPATEESAFRGWVTPFLGEITNAIRHANYNKLSEIMVRYSNKAQETEGLNMQDANVVLNFCKRLFQIFLEYKGEEGISRPMM